MTIDLRNFIKYGLLKNKMSFPNKFFEIKRYTQMASILKTEIDSINWDELIKEIKSSNSNIFVLSYILYAKNSKAPNVEYIEYVCSQIVNEFDFYVLYRFVSIIEDSKKKDFIIKQLLKQHSMVSILTEKELGNNFKMSYKNKILKERHNIIFDLENKFYNGVVEMSDLETIKKYRIHPSELSYYLSYTIDPIVKEAIFSYFLDVYPVNDIVFNIDKCFVQNIPLTLSKKIELKISAISSLEEITYLLIYKNKLNNKVLQRIFNEYLNEIVLNGFEPKTVNSIYIYLNPKYNTFTDVEDKINYIRYIAIYATILSKFYSLPVFVNNERIPDDDFKNMLETLKLAKFTVKKHDYSMDTSSSIVFAEEDIPAAIHWSLIDNIPTTNATVSISGNNVKNFISLISLIA